MALLTEAWTAHLDGCRKLAAAATPYATCGTLTRINGLVMEANGIKLPLGSGVRVAVGGGGFVEAEVVGFHGEKLYMMPTDDVFGLAPGAQVAPFEAGHARPRVGERIFARRRVQDRAKHLPVGGQLLGRVVDGAGRPLDGMGPLNTTDLRSLASRPVNPLP